MGEIGEFVFVTEDEAVGPQRKGGGALTCSVMGPKPLGVCCCGEACC